MLNEEIDKTVSLVSRLEKERDQLRVDSKE